MRKKILTLLLITILSVTTVGCAGGAKESKSNNEGKKVASENIQKENKEEDKVEEDKYKETPNNTPAENTTKTQVNTPSTQKKETPVTTKKTETTVKTQTETKKPSETQKPTTETPKPKPPVVAPKPTQITYMSDLTNSLKKLKNENKYTGIKYSSFRDLLMQVGSYKKSKEEVLSVYNAPFPPDDLCWVENNSASSTGKWEMAPHEMIITQFETSSNNAQVIYNEAKAKGFFKAFTRHGYHPDVYYTETVVFYNPKTGKNVVTRLAYSFAVMALQP